MFGRLLALFLLTPILELALLIQLGDLIGFWPTVGIIVVTGVSGTYLAKREGLSVWKSFNARLRAGGLPGTELIDGVIILIAAALLITPGVLTDVAGFIGLFPPTRAAIRRALEKRLQRAIEKGSVHVSFGGFENESNGWSGAPRFRSEEGTGKEIGDGR
ncbi:MAG: FxsA family protein [Rhodothermales bacterium]